MQQNNLAQFKSYAEAAIQGADAAKNWLNFIGQFKHEHKSTFELQKNSGFQNLSMEASALSFNEAPVENIKQIFGELVSTILENVPKDIKAFIAKTSQLAFLTKAKDSKIFKSSITFGNQTGQIVIVLIHVVFNNDLCDFNSRVVKGNFKIAKNYIIITTHKNNMIRSKTTQTLQEKDREATNQDFMDIYSIVQGSFQLISSI